MATKPTAFLESTSSRIFWVAVAAVAVLIICRIWAAGVLPLTDTTEARYSEMGRKMVETGDWLVPQHDYGVPFLAKPPLAMWLAAVGIELFGPNQFAPRIPILAWTLAFCAFFYLWSRRELGKYRALAGTVIMMSAFVFYMSAAAVMTDMVLTTCVAAALMCFWSRQHGGSAAWEVGLYVALGLGMLAKGPLAVVLALAPILGWCLWTGRTREVYRRFAWWRGALLALAICVPWYVAAEIRNPGFLRYFILGEYIDRFLIPDWSGDLYGRAHEVPRGTIWAFYLIGMLPWPVLLAPALLGARSRLRRRWNENRDFLRFAVLWAGAPLALFTVTANIIFPYALPAVPGTVALLAVAGARGEGDTSDHAALRTSWLAALLMVFGTVWLLSDRPLIYAHTQEDVIAAIHRRHPEAGYPIVYWQARYFSADYYSRGATSKIKDDGVAQALAQHRPFSLVIRQDRLKQLPDSLRRQLDRIAFVDDFVIFEPHYSDGSAASAATASPQLEARR